MIVIQWKKLQIAFYLNADDPKSFFVLTVSSFSFQIIHSRFAGVETGTSVVESFPGSEVA